jgi:hypothetical protein
MIKLYLVEPKTGKRLKLGEDFGYFGDYIQLTLTMAKDCIVMRDAIDPLGNDPMFNGRTYGNGRFILCQGEA